MADHHEAEQANSLAEQALSAARARLAPSETDASTELEAPTKKTRRKAAVNATSSTLQDLEKTLWATADKLRANMDAAEYKHLVLGLIFLKYISDSFAGRRVELERRFADANDDYYLGSDDAELLASELEERDYYKEVNVFWVPEVARWESLGVNHETTQIVCATEIESMKLRLTKRLGVGQSVGQRWCFVSGPCSAWLSGIKKPACGRALFLSFCVVLLGGCFQATPTLCRT